MTCLSDTVYFLPRFEPEKPQKQCQRTGNQCQARFHFVFLSFMGCHSLGLYSLSFGSKNYIFLVWAALIYLSLVCLTGWACVFSMGYEKTGNKIYIFHWRNMAKIKKLIGLLYLIFQNNKIINLNRAHLNQTALRHAVP